MTGPAAPTLAAPSSSSVPRADGPASSGAEVASDETARPAAGRPGAAPGRHHGTGPHHGLVLPPITLPRASTLTDLLLGAGDARGCGTGPPPRAGDLDALRDRLGRHLAAPGGPGMAGRRDPAGVRRRDRRAGPRTDALRVTGYLLRAGQGVGREAPPGAAAGGGPFAWSAPAARRALGLAAVRRCLADAAPAPAEAVTAVTAALATEGRHGLGRGGSLAAWLGSLAPPALAVVEAEAVTWATSLWTALEWERLGPSVQVGGPERQWAPAVTPPVSLRARVDVQVAGDPGGTGSGGASLTLLPGSPEPSSRLELGLAALVAAVGDGTGASAATPRRVAGWWPESGRALVVPVDRALLEETADAVVEAVAAVRARAVV